MIENYQSFLGSVIGAMTALIIVFLKEHLSLKTKEKESKRLIYISIVQFFELQMENIQNLNILKYNLLKLKKSVLGKETLNIYTNFTPISNLGSIIPNIDLAPRKSKYIINEHKFLKNYSLDFDAKIIVYRKELMTLFSIIEKIKSDLNNKSFTGLGNSDFEEKIRLNIAQLIDGYIDNYLSTLIDDFYNTKIKVIIRFILYLELVNKKKLTIWRYESTKLKFFLNKKTENNFKELDSINHRITNSLKSEVETQTQKIVNNHTSSHSK